MKRILLFIAFSLSLHVVFSQSPSLTTSIDKKQILIGGYIRYNVQATFPATSYSVNWFNVPDSFSHFEIVSRGRIDTVERNGLMTCRQQLIITSFDSGLNVIPSFVVGFTPATDDTTFNLLTDSIPVRVSFSPLDSTQNIHEIKSIIEVKEEDNWWIWIVIGAIILILIATIIYIIWYYRKKRKNKPVFESKLSPYDEAMQSLAKLSELLSKNEVKQFHSQLTEIFKRYVSRKTGNYMLNKTTSELLMSLDNTLLSRIDTAMLANSLRMTDAVKFAKYVPVRYESETALNDIKKIIEKLEHLNFNQ